MPNQQVNQLNWMSVQKLFSDYILPCLWCIKKFLINELGYHFWVFLKSCYESLLGCMCPHIIMLYLVGMTEIIPPKLNLTLNSNSKNLLKVVQEAVNR